ncbi:MAG: PIN domain-containing protein [Candidatus Nanopelagicales bacterium]|nr:PIN domain-containing protein [Candidatus Nanopelagicales bacterium]
MKVFVDTNVWYPVSVADLVLRSVEFGLFDLAWTEEVLEEVERVLVDSKGLPQVATRKFTAAIRAAAPDGRIDPDLYRHIVPRMTSLDADDHIHAAAVRGGHVDVLLTNNTRDFPPADVGSRCRVLRPDQFLTELARTYPIELARIVAEMAAHLRNPTMTPQQVESRLRRSGLDRFVDAVAPLNS